MHKNDIKLIHSTPMCPKFFKYFILGYIHHSGFEPFNYVCMGLQGSSIYIICGSDSYLYYVYIQEHQLAESTHVYCRTLFKCEILINANCEVFFTTHNYSNHN